MAKECNTCKKACLPYKEGHLKSLISSHGNVFASVNERPNSKFHTVIMTKEHRNDLWTMTDQEWADILPVLKESINKIENYHKFVNKPGPLGYRISIPIGELSGQNQPPHFYMRLVPTYKQGYGSVGINEIVEGKIATPEPNNSSRESSSA